MSTILEAIFEDLQHTQHMHELIARDNLTADIRALQTWQTNRLLQTHDDLWQTKRFKPAMQFFIDEIYGPKDFSQRDTEIAGVVSKIAKVLPEKGVESLQNALRLNRLSLELDITLVQKLGNNELNRHSYFDFYRQCDNQSKREEQIQLVENLGLSLAQVVKIRGVSTILMLSRKPAQIAGVKNLHEILERGFHSFKKLGDVHDFIDPIIQRERELMHALFNATRPEDNPLPY
jgi:hypothetical protein